MTPHKSGTDAEDAPIRLKTKKVEFHGRAYDVPIVPSIHQAVYDFAKEEGALNMERWHSCETTHCRAGWVVALAGAQGRKLEEQVSRRAPMTPTATSACLIYAASSEEPVDVVEFYVDNAAALEHMRACAERERAREMQSSKK